MSARLGIEATRRLQRAERRWLEQSAARLHRATARRASRTTPTKEVER